MLLLNLIIDSYLSPRWSSREPHNIRNLRYCYNNREENEWEGEKKKEKKNIEKKVDKWREKKEERIRRRKKTVKKNMENKKVRRN